MIPNLFWKRIKYTRRFTLAYLLRVLFVEIIPLAALFTYSVFICSYPSIFYLLIGAIILNLTFERYPQTINMDNLSDKI